MQIIVKIVKNPLKQLDVPKSHNPSVTKVMWTDKKNLSISTHTRRRQHCNGEDESKARKTRYFIQKTTDVKVTV